LRGSFSVRIRASNNQCAGTAEQAFAIAVADPSVDRIQLGQLVLTSSAIARVSGNTLISVRPNADAPNVIEDGTYKLGGETMLNRFMRFDGDITVTINKAQDRIDFDINQGKVYLVNVPRIGNKVLWEGGRVSFRVNGQGVLSGINESDKFLQSLEVAKLSLGIREVQILFAERGIRLTGNVKFPPLPGLTGLTGSFTSLELSQQTASSSMATSSCQTSRSAASRSRTCACASDPTTAPRATPTATPSRAKARLSFRTP
jgi:hypothetical protein